MLLETCQPPHQALEMVIDSPSASTDYGPSGIPATSRATPKSSTSAHAHEAALSLPPVAPQLDSALRLGAGMRGPAIVPSLALPDLPDDALVAILGFVGAADRRSARSACPRLRRAVNLATTRLAIDISADSEADPDPLVVPPALLPQLRFVELYAYKSRHEEGLPLRSAQELRGLGLDMLSARCEVHVILRHERASVDVSLAVERLREGGMWQRASRVCLRVDGWHGPPVDFGGVEVQAEIKIAVGERSPLPRVLALSNLTTLSIISVVPADQQAPDWRALQQCAPTLHALDVNADAPLADVFGTGLVWARLRSMGLAVPTNAPSSSQVSATFADDCLRALDGASFPVLQRLLLRFQVSLALPCCVPDLGRVLMPLAGLPSLADLEVVGDIRGFQGLAALLPRVQRLSLTHSCPAMVGCPDLLAPQLSGDEFSQLTCLRELRLTNIRAGRGLAPPPRLATLWLRSLSHEDVRQVLMGLCTPAARHARCEVCVHARFARVSAECSKWGEYFGVPGWRAQSALVSPDGNSLCQKYVRLVRC